MQPPKVADASLHDDVAEINVLAFAFSAEMSYFRIK
jgi:hypothetical protein